MTGPSITIKDVAALAGASPATASRVLSGNPATSAESRQRVAAAVTQLDFHPNAQARALRSTGTNVIVTAAPLNSAPMSGPAWGPFRHHRRSRSNEHGFCGPAKPQYRPEHPRHAATGTAVIAVDDRRKPDHRESGATPGLPPPTSKRDSPPSRPASPGPALESRPAGPAGRPDRKIAGHSSSSTPPRPPGRSRRCSTTSTSWW